jgi:hypothetical protein
MISTESEEFRQAARECLYLALRATEPELKASYEHLAGSYQHLADKMAAWEALIEAERVILDAAKCSLAAQKPAASPSEQPQTQRSLSAKMAMDTRVGQAEILTSLSVGSRKT